MSRNQKESPALNPVPVPFRALTVLSALMALAPPVLAIYLVTQYAHDIPVGDSWDLVQLLRLYDEGELTIGHLWALHNEHRLFFPKLLFVAMALLSDWNLAWERFASVLLASGSAILLVALCARAARRAGTRLHWLVAPLISLIVFSCTQEENWLNGWQVQIFMNLFAFFVAVCALDVERFGSTRLVCAIAAATVASYSFANGLLTWWCILPLVALAEAKDRRSRLLRTGIWLASAAVVTAGYLYGFKSPPGMASVTENVLNAGAAGSYVLAYLGNPLFTANNGAAIAAGAVGLVLFALPLVRAWRRGASSLQPLLPFLAIGLYAIASALLTASGRASFGPAQALVSRYISISNLLWLAIVGLWCVRLATGTRRRVWFPGAVLVLAALIVSNQRTGFKEAADRYEIVIPARDNLVFEHGMPFLNRILYPVPEALEKRVAFMRKKGYAAFGGEHEYDPSHARIHVRHGNYYLKQGLGREAGDLYRIAIKMDPNYAEPHLKLAQVLMLNRDFNTARPHLERALALRPGWPEAERLLNAVNAQPR